MILLFIDTNSYKTFRRIKMKFNNTSKRDVFSFVLFSINSIHMINIVDITHKIVIHI